MDHFGDISTQLPMFSSPSNDDPPFRVPRATSVWYQSRVQIGLLIRSVLGIHHRHHRHHRLVITIVTSSSSSLCPPPHHHPRCLLLHHPQHQRVHVDATSPPRLATILYQVSTIDWSVMDQIRCEPHPLDTYIFRKDAEYNPLPTFHYAQSQDLTFTLVVDVEVASNYISLDIVNILQLNVWPHPSPYYLDGYHHILFQCRLPFRVGQYEDELLCDVTTIKSVGVIAGRDWMIKSNVCYNRKGRPSSIHGGKSQHRI